jgi:hypothetical protein
MTDPKSQHTTPRERLVQKMSEVISLREKVAQAELAAHAVGRSRDNVQQAALPKK